MDLLFGRHGIFSSLLRVALQVNTSLLFYHSTKRLVTCQPYRRRSNHPQRQPCALVGLTPRSSGLLLQIPVKLPHHLGEGILPGLAVGEGVDLAGVVVGFIVLPHLDAVLDDPVHLGEVDVGVGGAVEVNQRLLQALLEGDGGPLGVELWALLGGAAEVGLEEPALLAVARLNPAGPLGEVPDPRDVDPQGKLVGMLGQGVKGHVAAVTEAVDPYPIRVDEGQPLQVAPGLDDVLQVIDTHLVVEGVAEVAAVADAAAEVYRQGDIALVGQVLVEAVEEGVGAERVPAAPQLPDGSAVDPDQGRVAFAGVEIVGLHQEAVDVPVQGALVGDALGRAELIPGPGVGQGVGQLPAVLG